MIDLNTAPCGLYCCAAGTRLRYGHTPAALCAVESIAVNATVVDGMCEVAIAQTYVNRTEQVVDGEYVFPLDSRAAVCAFEAEVDGRRVVGTSKEKSEARRDYNDALARGDGAFLLDQEAADIFVASVGSVLPFQRVVVRITYVAELKLDEAGRWRFLLPTHVAPRYAPLASYTGWVRDDKWPPRTIAAVLGYVCVDVPYTLKVELNCEMTVPVKSIALGPPLEKLLCADGSDGVLRAPADGTRSQKYATKIDFMPTTTVHGTKATLLTYDWKPELGDLVVLIETEQPPVARVCVEVLDDAQNTHAASTTGKSTAALVTLVPRIQLRDRKIEAVFLVDCSGSMAGAKMADTKRALQLFLRSLPQDCFFNVVKFGSALAMLFEGGSCRYSQETLGLATVAVDALQANMGGTEILAPLRHVVGQAPIAGYARQVFLLTDGEVSNVPQVLACVRDAARGYGALHGPPLDPQAYAAASHKDPTRVFALGVGRDVSHELVEGVARNGNGTCAFVAEGEAPETKIIKQLKDALQPALTNVRVAWLGSDGADLSAPAPAPAPGFVELPQPSVPLGEALAATTPQGSIARSMLGYTAPDASPAPTPRPEPADPSNGLLVTPCPLPPIFDGEPLLVYALFESVDKVPTRVVVTADSPDGPIVVELPVNAALHTHGKMLHTLAARRLIRDLEDGAGAPRAGWSASPPASANKAKIVRLATRYQLASTYTSFVAVEERTQEERSRAVLRNTEHGAVLLCAMPASMSSGFSFGAPAPSASRGAVAACAMPASRGFSFGAPAPTLSAQTASFGMPRGGDTRQCDTGASFGGGGGTYIQERMEMSAGPQYDSASSFTLSCSPPSRGEGSVGGSERGAPMMKSMPAKSTSRGFSLGGFSFGGRVGNNDGDGDSDDGAMDVSAAPADPAAEVARLVAFQEFDGSFRETPDILNTIPQGDGMIAIVAELSTVPKTVVARVLVTIIALVLLETRYKAQAASTQFVVQKARAWLAANVAADRVAAAYAATEKALSGAQGGCVVM